LTLAAIANIEYIDNI